MFLRINDSYAIRGWKNFETALFALSTGKTVALSRNEFLTLLLCDGVTDIDIDKYPFLQQTIDAFLKEGIVSSLESPLPLLDKQRYRYFDNRYVRTFFWSVTGRCNYQCKHCYMNAPDGKLGEPDTEEALELIDEIKECGGSIVSLTGGEPLVRNDFWQIVDYLLENDIHIHQVYTNGRLLDEKTIYEFEKRDIKPEIIVSFDGIGWHDWLRGYKGAEKAAIDALILCRQHGFPTSVEMCVHRGSVSSIIDTLKLLSQIDVGCVKIAGMTNTPLWQQNNGGYALSEAEYIDAILGILPAYLAEHLDLSVTFSGFVRIHDKIETQLSGMPYQLLAEKSIGYIPIEDCLLCGVTRSTCYISPDGRLLPCLPMTENEDLSMFPKINELGGLRNVLKDSYYMNFVSSRVKDLCARNKECAQCAYLPRCHGGCRANALHNTGDLFGKDESQCYFFKAGVAERVQRIMDDAFGNVQK